MKTIAKFLDRALGQTLAILILCQASILVLSVFFRFILNNPITWVDELSRYCLVALTFLGIGHVTKEHKEILVSIADTWIMKLFKTRSKKICLLLDFLADIIIVVLLSIMVYYGTKVAVWRWPVKGETVDWIRIGHVYGLIPVGSAIGLVYFFRRWYLYFKKTREKLNKDIDDVE